MNRFGDSGEEDRMDGVEEEIDCVRVDAVPRNSHLGVNWGPGNRLLIYGTRNFHEKALQKDPRKSTVANRDMINIASWDRSVGATRKLVCETYGPFMNLQVEMKRIPVKETGFRTRPLLSTSRHYRSFLRDMSIEVSKKVEAHGRMNTAPILLQQLKTAQTNEIALHLAEIFFLSPVSYAAPNIYDFLDWQFPVDPEAGMDLAERESPENSPSYWPLFFRYLLRGKGKEAKALLELHSEVSSALLALKSSEDTQEATFENLCFHLIVRLVYSNSAVSVISMDLIASITFRYSQRLLDVPALGSAVGFDEFFTSWKSWQLLAQRTRSKFSAVLDDYPEIAHMLQIIAGDMTAIRNQAQDWKELLIATIIFTTPQKNCSELGPLYDECTQRLPNFTDPLSELYRAAFNVSILDFVRHTIELDDWWLSAHMLDLLHHRGVLSLHKIEETGLTQRQTAFLEYALAMATDEISPQIIIEYLVHSDMENVDVVVEQIISRVPIRSDRDAHRLLGLLHKVNLSVQTKRSISSRIHKLMTRRHLTQGLIGPAIAWSAESDVSMSQNLADRLLDSLIIPLDQIDTEHCKKLDRVVESLDQSVLVRQQAEVHFLEIYRDVCMHSVLKQKKEVAELLVKALLGGALPRRFWLLVLRDCASLISAISNPMLNNTALFTPDQMADLMRFLEEICQSHDKEEYLKYFKQQLAWRSDKTAQENPVTDADVEVELEKMRMALTHSLGFAFMALPMQM